MVAAPGAWLKRVVLSFVFNHGCVVGVINQSECHLLFLLRTRRACT